MLLDCSHNNFSAFALYSISCSQLVGRLWTATGRAQLAACLYTQGSSIVNTQLIWHIFSSLFEIRTKIVNSAVNT